MCTYIGTKLECVSLLCILAFLAVDEQGLQQQLNQYNLRDLRSHDTSVGKQKVKLLLFAFRSSG